MEKIYNQGDYTYTLENDVWSVKLNEEVTDRNQTTYGKVLSEIDGFPVVCMNSTFENCTSLRKAPAIPESVNSLFYTFENCTSLTKAPIIPDGVKDMYCTFKDCTSLTQAPTIPQGVKYMSGTFYGCTSLTKAPTIPQGVEFITGAFMGCTSLTEAPIIPDGVKNMDGIFDGCTSLKLTSEYSKPSLSEQITSAKAETRNFIIERK